jgi:hypothetical protein
LAWRRPEFHLMRPIRSLLMAATLTAVLGFASAANAVPYETFVLDQTAITGGVPAGGAGTITVLQLNMDEVQVTVTLAPNLLINTGGPHTPFAFNLSSAATVAVNAGQGITVMAPITGADCSPAPAPCFTPAYAPGSATPYGTLSEALTYSGATGGGTAHGNDGPLVFTVTGAGVGNVTPDGVFSAFVPNSAGTIFAADLYLPSSGKTGTVAAFAGTAGDTGPGGGGSNIGVPEPASLALLGTGALMLLLRRKRPA